MKNNFITKIIGATLAFAMMIGGAVGINAAKEAKEVNAAAASVEAGYQWATMTAGTNGSAAVVNYNSGTTSHSAIKVGTGSKGGDMKISVPAGTISLKVYAYAWNGVNDLSLNITVFSGSTGATINPASISLTANSGMSSNSPFTYSGTAALTEIVLSGIEEDTVLKFETSSAKRFVAWDAQVSTGLSVPCAVTYSADEATSGTVPVDDTEYEAGDTVTVLGNTGGLTREDYTLVGWTDGDTEYEAGDTFVITADTTLYAVWNTEAGIDSLVRTFTGINNGASYGNWSGKTGQSGAVYAGNTAGGNDSIQLRSSDNSGIISTTSGGNIKRVTVVWESNTQTGRTLNIYGKNTAYSSTADLYNASTRGTLLGTIVNGTSTSFVITGDYHYVGVCSNANAMYLTELRFKWEEVQLNPRVEFSPASLTLKTNQTSGATVTALVEDVETPTYSWVANDNNVTLENANTATVTIKPNTQVAADSTVTLTVGGTTPNLVETLNVTIEIPGPGETAGTAYTVAQAKAAIAAADADIENVYIAGIVSQLDEISLSNHNATYWISDDGTTANQFEIYRGKYVDNENFTSNDQIMEGDEVIVYGTISKQHGSLNQGNYLVSMDLAPRVTSISLTPNAVTAVLGSDGNIIDLFTNITISQETGSNKTADDIIWTSEDDDVFAVINDVQYIAGDTHRSSTTIHAFIGLVEYASATVTIFQANTHVMNYNLPEEWRLVTDPSTLAAGDQVILTGIKGETLYAAGTYASGNNLKADGENILSASNGVATGVVDTMIYTLEAGSVEGSVAFKDSNDKYLCAVSSSDNYMKVQNDINGNASFILNSDGSVVAQGSYSRKYMRYNNTGTSNLFSCYASGATTGELVTFYKYSTGTAELDLFNLAAVQSAHEDENGAYINLGASLSAEDWAAIDSAFGIAGYGVMLIRETTLETTGFDTIEGLFNSESANKSKLANLGKDSDTAPQDYSIEAKINITNESNRSVVFCAATYVKADSGAIYFINETRGSLVGLL